MSRPSVYARGLDLAFALGRQSPWLWASVALVVASLVAQCVWLPRLRQERDDAIVRLEALRARHVRGITRPEVVATVASSVALRRLEAFQAVLGPADHQEELTRTMFAAARETGLVLTEGSYVRVAEKSGAYLRLEVSQPVRGTYAQTRAYCDRILAAVPYAALDDLHFKREGVAAPAGEAVLRWTFYLRAADATRAPNQEMTK